MPPEWKEPRPSRDSPLSGTGPDVCGQTGLASQDVRAANCGSRYCIFTHSQPGCFALQVIKQGNGADVYESDPCATAPHFCLSTSARTACSINSLLLCSPLSQCQALKQILLELCAAAAYSFCCLRRAKLLAVPHALLLFHRKGKKGRRLLLSESCPSGTLIMLPGGREECMRQRIPELMLTFRSLPKMRKTLKSLSDSSIQPSLLFFFFPTFWVLALHNDINHRFRKKKIIQCLLSLFFLNLRNGRRQVLPPIVSESPAHAAHWLTQFLRSLNTI